MGKAQLLNDLRARNQSSPAAIYWEEFRQHLVRSAKTDEQFRLPNPLILGGDIASHFEKHSRLAAQLDWADVHGCLEEALSFLLKLPASAWNTSDGSDWNDVHPWTRGE